MDTYFFRFALFRRDHNGLLREEISEVDAKNVVQVVINNSLISFEMDINNSLILKLVKS